MRETKWLGILILTFGRINVADDLITINETDMNSRIVSRWMKDSTDRSFRTNIVER